MVRREVVYGERELYVMKWVGGSLRAEKMRRWRRVGAWRQNRFTALHIEVGMFSCLAYGSYCESTKSGSIRTDVFDGRRKLLHSIELSCSNDEVCG